MSVVLVVNSGSSSLKYRLLDPASETVLAAGLIERIGQPAGERAHTVFFHAAAGEPAPAVADATYRAEGAMPDHDAAFAAMLDAFAEHGPSLAEHPPVVVGHRVVHGGERFVDPTVVTDEVEAEIARLAELAPLHNPPNLVGIAAARRAFADVPHVAVFDTAFHRTLPPAAYTYAIDREVAASRGIRRYGFHGTSHRFVNHEAARFLRRPVQELRHISFHLGNGASVTAIDGGRSVDTSMGLTPLEGLVMGTRSGDIDPAALLMLARAGWGADEIDLLLNHRSGMLGMAGASDMRDVLARRDAGDEAAALAFDVYVHRLRAYAGAYAAELGGVDVITFTAGIGENSPPVRAAALETLGFAGVQLDPARNQARDRGVRRISTDDSAVEVLVVPTDEELEIARESLAAIGA